MTFEPKTDETSRIEAALDELLTAILEHEAHNPRGDAGQEIGEALEAAIGIRMNGTSAQISAAALLPDPIGQALRDAIATLGERLYEIGGLVLMRVTCSRLEAQDDANAEIRAGILDHQWNGIGSDEDGGGWFA